jgi:hypothetical protein
MTAETASDFFISVAFSISVAGTGFEPATSGL